jgi:DNA-binding ferritin-like protein
MVTNLLTLHNQLKIFHWQTPKYSAHVAYGDIYTDLSDLIDEFVEIFMGKYGKIKNKDGFQINLVNLNNDKDEVNFIDTQIKYISFELKKSLKEDDTDLFNIIDEMLSKLNKLKYLLTLQ